MTAAKRRPPPARRRTSPPGPDERARPGRAAGRIGWAAAAIILAAVLAYANSLATPFMFDDFGSVVRNPQIRDLWNVRRVFSPPEDTAVAGRPLVNLSFAVNFAAGGLDVTGYHLVNLAVHLVCALLVFGLVRRTLALPGVRRPVPSEAEGPDATPSVALAGAVAVLWTVHPLNSEAVDYVTQRTESMMAACYLWTLYASVRAFGSAQASRVTIGSRIPDHGPRQATSVRRQQWWLWTGVLSCGAGMACKESMFTAPLMVVLYDAVFLFGSPVLAWRARWRFYSGLAATWSILAALIASHGSISTSGFASAHSTSWNYLLNQTVMITRYLRLVVWPHPLVSWYGWVRELTLADVWPYALLVSGLFVLAILAFVRRPRVGFLGLAVFITLGPSSSVAPIITEVGAERRMYLPLVAIVTMVVLAAAALSDRVVARPSARGRWPRPAIGFVWAIVVAGLASTTFARNRDYASALTMAETVLAGWPTPMAHQLVGQELASVGRHDEAIEHLREAARGYPPAHYWLGSELFNAGKPDDAIVELQRFVAAEPTQTVVPTARILMGRAHASARRWPQAIEQARLVLAGSPSHVEAHGLLAEALAGQQAHEEAAEQYRVFVAARPADAAGWTGLAVALMSSGKTAEAIEPFRHAVELAPASLTFRQNLARALLAQGDVDGAVEQVRQAAALNPNDAAAHELLARVLASQGQVPEARREVERALQIDPSLASARELLRSLPPR